MAEKVKTPLRQFSSDKPFKLVISENLERKIRTYCALSPEREWSGVLFYTFEGDFETGVTIYGNDFYLMDRGTQVHTEFDLNEPEITKYMIMEELTDHCMGLLHSHNQMRAFFSGEDSSTLQEYGGSMNNFVSLVVCNEGTYVARLTRQANIKGTTTTVTEGVVTTPIFNTSDIRTVPYRNETRRKEDGSYIEYIDLEIVKPASVDFDDAIERFGVVDHKCSSVLTKAGKSAKDDWKNYGNPKMDYPSLFNDDDDLFGKASFMEEELSEALVKEVKSVHWQRYNFDRYFAQLMLGSPFAKDFNMVSVHNLSNLYKERFANELDFNFWFESWLDYIVADFVSYMGKFNEGFFSKEEVFLGKVYLEISKLPVFTCKQETLSIILQRLT